MMLIIIWKHTLRVTAPALGVLVQKHTARYYIRNIFFKDVSRPPISVTQNLLYSYLESVYCSKDSSESYTSLTFTQTDCCTQCTSTIITNAKHTLKETNQTKPTTHKEHLKNTPKTYLLDFCEFSVSSLNIPSV